MSGECEKCNEHGLDCRCRKEWISVEKDGLPSDKTAFLGTDGEIIFSAYWCTDTDSYKVGGWESCYYCGGASRVVFEKKSYYDKIVTHWMRLPEPPKIENEK